MTLFNMKHLRNQISAVKKSKTSCWTVSTHESLRVYLRFEKFKTK